MKLNPKALGKPQTSCVSSLSNLLLVNAKELAIRIHAKNAECSKFDQGCYSKENRHEIDPRYVSAPVAKTLHLRKNSVHTINKDRNPLPNSCHACDTIMGSGL